MLNADLDTTIEFLKGVGPKRAEVLQKELGIYTYADLLGFYPFRYIDRTRFYKVSELDPELPYVQILGRITGKETIGEKHKKRIVARLTDETGTIELVWFQSLKWVEENIMRGKVYIAFGKPTVFNGSFSISHPELEPYPRPATVTGNLTLQPVYNSTEKLKKFSIDSKGIQKLQALVITSCLSEVRETLPAYILEKYKLISRKEALLHIHFPADSKMLQHAQRRLKFEELFFIQLQLLANKQFRELKFKGHRFCLVGNYVHTFYQDILPFELTNAQKRVIKEIRTDTQRGIQMNRLVQGDVGSGKTVVALMSMLLANDNGFQACMMAPTEILARQHYHSIFELVGDQLIRVAILTGTTTKKQRTLLHAQLEAGEIDILIGTHALIEDKVVFKNLGLVVIDEQHRFGVEQRAKLWRKNAVPPHILVMTATPIPRTLAMTIYGDLDVSVIDELPAGRKPIDTRHLYEGQRLRMFGFMKTEIAKGRQVYVVYPLIKESEKLDLLHLEAGIEQMRYQFPLPDYQISIVHGKMPNADKQFEMDRFITGKTQIMVATTVIEVGVNVPNASVMIIENAERFGLSQLHQLRGRVGRGAEQSFCILMSGNKLSKEGRKRLETMVRTNNGFEISEIDLELRGPGDLSGTQQSGVLDLKLADLVKDQQILQEARNTVIDIFQQDPLLTLPENALLKRFTDKKNRGIALDKIS
ncbi:ATP-dependent DNA helicase RecG [Pedobacter antarcticus 4BY]|uniref:ATP-dependent DNA helicase RecG n=2 Tax=Pedobacter antarcticus TaxID=34086 RepID=A0A081PF01_9SPHI|nr:ATP-dependent DNA helicase RecG [Pedobacter antarcticus]KEQ29274.1 ATP-dependent DNA helicase RecG [Pedobacter antarcticus 4BY]SFE75815.1 ATP-dependent DNA helicase RecG [Pedobacter antarcticus]